MLRPHAGLLVVALVLGLAGCAAGAIGPSGAAWRIDETATPNPQPASDVLPSQPSPSPSAPTSPTEASDPLLSGDAETNESCRLADVSEIEQQVGARVLEMRGLTSPGAYGEHGLSCTWYLDSSEVGIPSVVVQWEYPVGHWHDSVVDLYRLQVEQALASQVPEIGDFTILQGGTAETVAGERIVRVTVLMHPAPTEEDQANAIALLELMLSRTER